MRWLAGLLVVINLGYFVWQAGQLPDASTASEDENTEAISLSKSDNSLTLLSELSEPPPLRLAPPPSCWKLGLFSIEAEMMPIAERIAGDTGSIKVHQREIKSKPLYWIVIGPFESIAAAERELKSILSTHNIEAFVIKEGDLAANISLGRFSNGLAAQKELNRRKQQGYDVKLHTQQLTKQQFGAELTWPTLPPEEEALLAEISKRSRSKELPFIFLKKRCKSIASR